MKRDLNLESWKVFAAVARTGSITETSAELEMDAPSISRIVSGLEKSLGGISLFDRSSLPLTLTDNGRFALEYATKMITLHDQLVTGLAANTDAMSGVLRVGVPPALLQGFLMPFFVSFGRRYPEIQLEVSEYLGGIPRGVARCRDVIRPGPHALELRPDPVRRRRIHLLRVTHLHRPLRNAEDA